MTDEDFTADDELEPEERDWEAPAADAVEQATTSDPAEERGDDNQVHRGLEVNDWDAVEQARVVDVSDEY
jgi:hypothetical protein